ncbi:hypothetical protein GCM10029992_01240 [Glycomyces albus]|uniref:hypothetical protein n=1 Tax=Glycomyces salinus TaxID=980294 RepID=UPI0018ECEFAB|nr:hypothetical protein [Glycomyces salinus]
MPSIEGDKVRALSKGVHDEVLPILQEASLTLPKLREIDQSLYTSVAPSLAIAYTMGTGYMNAMVQGASECFTELSEALVATVEEWEQTDADIAGNVDARDKEQG